MQPSFLATLHDDDPDLTETAAEHGDPARVRRYQPMRLAPALGTAEAGLRTNSPQPSLERQVRAAVQLQRPPPCARVPRRQEGAAFRA
jgi:hypothetical protein